MSSTSTSTATATADPPVIGLFQAAHRIGVGLDTLRHRVRRDPAVRGCMLHIGGRYLVAVDRLDELAALMGRKCDVAGTV